MPEISLRGYECTRCHHKWIPRDNEKPKVCPKCKSPYWDVKKIGRSDKSYIFPTNISETLNKIIEQSGETNRN